MHSILSFSSSGKQINIHRDTSPCHNLTRIYFAIKTRSLGHQKSIACSVSYFPIAKHLSSAPKKHLVYRGSIGNKIIPICFCQSKQIDEPPKINSPANKGTNIFMKLIYNQIEREPPTDIYVYNIFAHVSEQ